MGIIKKYGEFILIIYGRFTPIPKNINSFNFFQRLWLLATGLFFPFVIALLIPIYEELTDEYIIENYGLQLEWIPLYIAYFFSPVFVYYGFTFINQAYKWISGDFDITTLSINRAFLINILLVLAIIALVVLIIRWITF